MIRGSLCIADMLHLCWLLIAAAVVTGEKDLRTGIDKYVRVYSSIESNVINVTINSMATRQITGVTPLNGLSDPMSGTEALYKVLGCEAANWTLNEVYEFVSWSRMFDNGENGERDENEDGFEKGFARLEGAVRGNVGRLIDVLDTVLRSADDRLRYVDTSVLETLFALQMDVHFLSANLSNKMATQNDAYRVLAADMTAAQKYLAGNCANAPADAVNPDSLTFGYWFRRHSGPEFRSLFWSEARALLPQLQAQGVGSCNPVQMLLEDIVRPSSDCVVAEVISKSEIILQEKIVSMNDAYRMVRTAYDVDVVLWYAESVMAALVKAVLSQILHELRLSCRKCVQPYASRIDAVYMLVAPAGRRRRSDLPDCLIDGFTALKAFSRYGGSFDDLQKYYDSLTSVQSPPPFERSSVRRMFLNMAFAKIFEHLQPNVGSFESFGRCYECLRDRREQYHFELSTAAAAMVAKTAGSEGNDQNVCDFLAIVHSTCRRIYASLYTDSYARNNKPMKNNAYHTILQLLDDVRLYVQPIVDKRTRDKRLLLLTYDVVAVLANIPRRRWGFEPKLYATDVQRYLNVIVSVLGYAGLRWYCHVPGTLSTFRIWYANGDDNIAASQRQRSLLEFSSRNLFRAVDAGDVAVSAPPDPLNVNNVYNVYVASSCVVAVYENRVLFTWKGRPTTLMSMFWNVARLPVDTRVLLSLYDAYFTFYVAAACYEIDQTPLGTDEDAAEAAKEFDRLASRYAFKEQQFPGLLQPFVADVVSLLASFADSVPSDPPEAALSRVMARKRIVDDQLIRFGVTFHQPDNVSEKVQWVISTLFLCAAPMVYSLNDGASDFIANLYHVPLPPKSPPGLLMVSRRSGSGVYWAIA